MAFSQLESSRRAQLARLGEATLNALFPKEFEYYLLALELVNSQGQTVDYFAFPVLPDEINEIHREITNVRKTVGGVNVLKNPTFVPRELMISGQFGRKIRVLINNNELTFAGFRFSVRNGVFDITKPGDIARPQRVFSSFAKTGYGMVKIIEAIKEKSKKLDNFGKPFSLYCYNPILGNNYQVEIISFSHKQDSQQNNRVPRYSLQMIAVAPLDALLSDRINANSAIKNLAFSNLQKEANKLASRIRRSIGI